MGWSQPNVPVKDDARSWSPWICLFIIFAGIFFALIWVVLHSSVGGVPSLASGYWLPLTMKTLAGISVAIAAYLLWWEIQAVSVWNWNVWRRNMNILWRKRAHQHIFVAHYVTLTADPQLLPRLAGVATENGDDAPALTLLPDEPLIPGISRFEQLCRLLINQIKSSLFQRHSTGPLTVLVQTSASDNEQELRSFTRLWADEKLPWTPDIQILPNEYPFSRWDNVVSSTRVPVLVVALHYRQPGESLAEFACALLLTPGSMLASADRKIATRLFRAMPLNSVALIHELKELRDMGQQPANQKHLVWHAGLAAGPRQSLGRMLNELSLPLYDDVCAGGVVDFDKKCGIYGGLVGWLMVAAATEMASYGPRSQWLLCESEKEAWAVVLGQGAPVTEGESGISSPPPYPAGSMLLALLFNVGLFSVIQHYPSLAFSWAGVVILFVSLVVTLPCTAFLLRNMIARLQHPLFVKAAGQSGKE
ncbi:hypothetical protein SAMN05428971_0260 [Candidatus Pantoea varia]|uniref:Uncharacterized protein n=1 Tax=Candidatus Pantoea varia TaxID=1881036 RepID=A0A1I4WNM5_9GAMM|nr:hypothetical protein [Pantoea varia]SFN15037.1 hypothetical protein SAMN05428971_0260 [Pantoea varia]